MAAVTPPWGNARSGAEKRGVMPDVAVIDARGGPRVTFTVFGSSEDPMLRAWLRFRSPLIGSSNPDAQPAFGRGGDDLPRHDRRGEVELGFWRLLASNNRELGRSFLLYRGFEQAREHVQHLQTQSHSLEVAYVSGPVHGSRGWVVTSGDAPVMTCSRWYDSTSARASAASGSIAALVTAHVSDAPDRSGPSGRFLKRPERARL